jgi:hypothetical protein
VFFSQAGVNGLAGRIGEDRNAFDPRDDFLQKRQLLCRKLWTKGSQPREILARSGEARSKSEVDRIAHTTADEWDHGRRRDAREGRYFGERRHDVLQQLQLLPDDFPL